MAKKNIDATKSVMVIEVDPNECPFREFKDNEMHTDLWGLGPAATRTAMMMSKGTAKSTAEVVWVDEQTQPLPRSVRQYLNGWVRAEDLALARWDAEVIVFEVEHQWENFVFNIQPEGWRARYHIYSPGMKPGGGAQHRPGLSRNGCYLVRLYYLGAWRCVWVSDQVPVDATDSPLLPFSPLILYNPGQKNILKNIATAVTAPYVHLWPLLLCKDIPQTKNPDLMPLTEEQISRAKAHIESGITKRAIA